MNVRARALVSGLALALSLAACGGTNTVVSGGGGGGGGQQVPPGSLSVAPTSLSFSGAGAAAQTFTVSSTVPNLPAPQFNASGCSPVATIATTSTTLPATYTVTPTGNGSCSFTFDIGNASAALGVTVGPSNGNTINGSTQNVNLFVGGPSGTVSVSSSTGTFTYDATPCNGIATVTAQGNVSGTQTYSIAPVAGGTCQFIITSGAASFVVGVAVTGAVTGPGALTVSPTSMTFSNSTASAPQQGTLSFTGSVGQVSINEGDCIGNTGKPKLAYLTVNGTAPGAPISLPASFTVTLYGGGATGSCTIQFVPQNGASASLAVTVNP